MANITDKIGRGWRLLRMPYKVTAYFMLGGFAAVAIANVSNAGLIARFMLAWLVTLIVAFYWGMLIMDYYITVKRRKA